MPSTIHRFTPPTCTLEIVAQKSLIHWTARNADKISPKTRFKLRFDDPRQATSKQVTIEGTQADLLQLQTAIDSYIKTQLRSSFESIDAERITQPPTKTNEGLPYLKPLGLMHHELYFGVLTHDSDRQKLKLGTVQLFDLVTALEEYQTKIAVSNTEAKPPQQIALWGKIAAVAIAIGSIAIVANLLKPQPQPNIASDRERPKSTTAVPKFGEITPPTVPDGDYATRTSGDRQPVNPKLGEPIASTKRLPPPPAVETPKPKPDIPDPADYPLSQVARQTGLDNSVKQNSIKQKPSQPQSTEAETETEILGEASSEVISSPKNQNRQKNEADTELDLQAEEAEDTVRETELTAIPTQLSQKQEVIAYFNQNWQPPEDLQQSLEYRLFIAPDGSIQRVIPLGKAARIYLGKTEIPVDGKPFITPVSTDRTAIVRVLLNPDGKVQAFEE